MTFWYFYIYFTVTLCIACTGYCEGAKCVGTIGDPCSCTFDDGSGTVDITSLGKTGGTPRLLDHVSTGDTYQYSYNPCKPFTEHECKDVAVCAILSSGSTTVYLSAGQQNQATFGMIGTDVVVTYKTTTLLKTEVTLKCDEAVTGEPAWDVQGQGQDGVMRLTMTHAQCCPMITIGGLSVGSILCIIFLVCLVVYFGFGALFMFFIKKESGINVVPNHKFWSNLPGQIKDGGKFVVGSVKGKDGYSEI